LLEVLPLGPGVLQVSGSVELATVAELREKLAAAVDDAITDALPVLSVDLSGSEMVDAAGLGVLLGAHRRARRGGTRLRLVRLTPELSHLLLVSRLYRVLDVEGRDFADSAASSYDAQPLAHRASPDGVPRPRNGAADERPLASS
jgi:anti-anti-sigma factor